MKELRLQIPDYISDFLEKLSGSKDAFVVDAILSQMQSPNDLVSEQLMIEGYKNDNLESAALKQDFTDVDLEHWDEY